MSLEKIFEELTCLRDNFQEGLRSIQQVFNGRFESLATQLQVLDTIPNLVRRVEDNESGLNEVKEELSRIKEQLGNTATSVLATETSLEIEERIKSLEHRNAVLSSRLAKVNTPQLVNNTGLVIGGLTTPDSADLKNWAYCVLKTIYQDLEAHDVISARHLRRRQMPSPGGAKTLSNTLTVGGSTSSGITANPATPPGLRLIVMRVRRLYWSPYSPDQCFWRFSGTKRNLASCTLRTWCSCHKARSPCV